MAGVAGIIVNAQPTDVVTIRNIRINGLLGNGNPNAGTTYDIGDSGPSHVDQRRVVDPSFLDLVRLGVLPANDPAVVNTLGVVDTQLGVATARELLKEFAKL